jgi:(S)-citramalyl-CoA lyase
MEQQPARPVGGPTQLMPDRKFALGNLRSLLITPATRPERFAKAAVVGADALVVDLEDGVAFGQKAEGRAAALRYFTTPPATAQPFRCLRINSLHSLEGLRDLTALIEAGVFPDAILLAKTEAAAEIKILDDLLVGEFASIFFFALIETARGLEAVSEISLSSPRLAGLILGGADLAAEFKAEMGWDALFYARSRLIHAAALAGIGVIDVPYLDIHDNSKLEDELKAIRKIGFTGKVAIHPGHIPAIHRAFTPHPAEVERARRIIDGFEASQGGVCVVDGRMVDRPVVQGAYRIVNLAGR